MMTGNWERRWHPLLQEWVILAATTANRPWSGETLGKQESPGPEFDRRLLSLPGSDAGIRDYQSAIHKTICLHQ